MELRANTVEVKAMDSIGKAVEPIINAILDDITNREEMTLYIKRELEQKTIRRIERKFETIYDDILEIKQLVSYFIQIREYNSIDIIQNVINRSLVDLSPMLEYLQDIEEGNAKSQKASLEQP